MPPKKKGKTASPVVVGTVSTRSTRRQSVVNIEIPKLSRSKTRKDISCEKQHQVVKSSMDSGNLCEKIKATYCKVIGLTEKTFNNSPPNVCVSEKLLKKSNFVSPSSVSTDNKELLQILEDWSDEDSQDNKEGSLKIEYRKHKEFENLEFGAEDISKIISSKHCIKKKDFSIVKINEESETSFADIKEIERTLSLEKDELETSDNKERLNEEDISIDTETFFVSKEQIAIQENILDDQDENYNVMIECVTEEIVPVNEDVQLIKNKTSASTLSGNEPETDKLAESYTSFPELNKEQAQESEEILSESQVQMEVTEEVAEEVYPPSEEMIIAQEEVEINTNTPVTTPYDEEVDVGDQDVTTCEDIVISDIEGNSNNQMEIVVSGNNDETIQSLSTSDSNDSEVRNYFSKEIERNETVHKVEEEDNEEIEYCKSSAMEDNFMESTSNSSEVQYEEFAIPSNDEQSVETRDFSMDLKSINLDTTECIPGDSLLDKNNHENEETVTNLIRDKKNDIYQQSRTDVKISEDTKKINMDIEKFNDKNKQIFQVSEDNLTKKIGELNLEIPQQKVTTRNRKIAGAKECIKQVNENETVSRRNKKFGKKKVGISSKLIDNNEEMEVIEETKSRLKKNQKDEKNPSIVHQQASKKKIQKSKTKFAEISVESFGETGVSDSPTKSPKSKERKQKNADVKTTGKKSLPILSPNSTLKLSPNKKKGKDIVKKIEYDGKKGKECVKKLDQPETKKGREHIKKSDQEENKKLKEPIQKIDQLEISMRETIEKSENDNKSETDGEDVEVRRSSRIKSISVLKKKTTGHGLVRSKSEISLNESDISDNSSIMNESEKSTPLGTPSASPKLIPRERKTRWSKSMENLVAGIQLNSEMTPNQAMIKMEIDEKPKLAAKDDPVIQARLKQFIHLKENVYKTSRMTCKEAKKMTCDCFLTEEEIQANEYGCGDDCLNRLLLIECGIFCHVGDRCTNKRFQKGQFAPVEVFNTEKIGLGLRAAANIPFGEFILEYVGEVLNSDEFDKRAEVYSQDKNIHYYFMALRADAIIDATNKGNISRFINHSCDPNAETQKWTVNGELRIGFFSTRTILAGEEVTFDYRFQRYGKEAQKCYCGAAICRGWLGEEPDEESEEEDYEEEEEEIVETAEVSQIAQLPSTEDVKIEISDGKLPADAKPVIPDLVKIQEDKPLGVDLAEHEHKVGALTPDQNLIPPVIAEKKIVRKKVPKKKPRVELFEEIDQLNEEIEMLVATGLKNQAHTLKLSRLMVRAQEPQQRTKLLRVLRRGELPCRRLFLDYHGLRLMHGYMIDAQRLVVSDKKFESLRLEMLQTLAVLPIPNKTMLQDSKVLSTVEKWTTNKILTSPLDSDSNSPKTDQDVHVSIPKKEEVNKQERLIPDRSIEDQEEEIRFLASKLLEEWKNLKEVFRIPKKERIEQMKEHEREANKKFMQSGYGQDQDRDKKLNEMRYRGVSTKYKHEKDSYRKSSKNCEKYSAEFMKLSKIERRKLFAIQFELKEEERRLKQRELWRQHEMNCMMIGTDPRFTAPFDPSKPYQCIWNPQLGQWQTYPLPQNSPLISPQPPLPSTNLALSQLKNISNYFPPPLPPAPTLNTSIQQLPSVGMPSSVQPASMTVSHNPHINAVGSYGGLPNVSSTVLPNLTSHTPPQINLPSTSITQLNVTQLHGNLSQNLQQHGQLTPTNIPPASLSLTMSKDSKPKDEDPSQVRFMGPIPPPVKLPPKWKCAKDKYGRPYYYHVKMRKSQWEPPPLAETPFVEEAEFSESESSSDTSSESSGSSSENSDSEEEIDDTQLLMEVRKQMEKTAAQSTKSVIPQHVKLTEPSTSTPSPEIKFSGDSDMEVEQEHSVATAAGDEEVQRPSIDIRLKEQFNLKDDRPPKKKRRVGLCEEIIISPRSEEDKLQFKEDLKKYKANKEKLRRQKELIVQQTRRQLREVEQRKAREKRIKTSVKVKIKDMPDFNSEAAKKIKETFRANMASTVVSSLNAYRKSDCKEGRITNTDDFKHLARKLTHFVMLKEMKHITKIDDLLCTDNVKAKAREYIRKYMGKFGEVYIKRNDSPDFKD